VHCCDDDVCSKLARNVNVRSWSGVDFSRNRNDANERGNRETERRRRTETGRGTGRGRETGIGTGRERRTGREIRQRVAVNEARRLMMSLLLSRYHTSDITYCTQYRMVDCEM